MKVYRERFEVGQILRYISGTNAKNEYIGYIVSAVYPDGYELKYLHSSVGIKYECSVVHRNLKVQDEDIF